MDIKMYERPLKETYVKGKKLTEMKKGEIICIQKMKSGFDAIIECSFVKYERGIVYAKVLYVDREWYRYDFPKGKVITAKPHKCFLWGKDDTDPRIHWACCHWFKNGVVM